MSITLCNLYGSIQLNNPYVQVEWYALIAPRMVPRLWGSGTGLIGAKITYSSIYAFKLLK